MCSENLPKPRPKPSLYPALCGTQTAISSSHHRAPSSPARQVWCRHDFLLDPTLREVLSNFACLGADCDPNSVWLTTRQSFTRPRQPRKLITLSRMRSLSGTSSHSCIITPRLHTSFGPHWWRKWMKGAPAPHPRFLGLGQLPQREKRP